LLLACTRGGLAYGSPDDVADILRLNGVSPGKLTCKNPSYGKSSITRGVACVTTLTAADVATLKASVPLSPGKAQPYGDTNNCKVLLPGATDVLVGKNTKAKNGASHVEVHLAPSGDACVEIHYPWG
jgi:hypothetical protein